MNILNAPLFWLSGVGLLLAFVMGFVASKSRSIVTRGILFAITALCVLIPGYLLAAVHAPHWIDARYRDNKAFHDETKIGMSRGDALAALEKHHPADGPRRHPKIMAGTAHKLGFFTNLEHSHEPNWRTSSWISKTEK